MPHDHTVNIDSGRRNLLKTIGTGAIATAVGGSLFADPATAASTAPKSAGGTAAAGPFNILLFLTDQERYFGAGELPADYHLPARERLARNGVVFDNHRINSCVCTPSRSVLYTGRHIQHTRMFDNTNFPWIQSLSTELKTMGHLLREAGYYTAYKGKWHLTKEFETVNKLDAPEKIFTKEMEAYGFADYFGIGDIIAHEQGGYLHDGVIASMAVSWLRGRAAELARESKPWFLAVNLVNPHDVMFYNTDRADEPVQARNILGRILPEPAHPLYAEQWPFELPRSFAQPLDARGRPPAHADYIASHDVLVGRIPERDEWRWRKRHNFYLNCLRDVDRQVLSVLDELETLGLDSRTIVILTADHGDLDGAHRLHAKGATSYREQNHVPLIVAHPAIPGGKRCAAVTSHLDLAPTLVALTDAAPEKKAAVATTLPGKDFSHLLTAPEQAGHDAVRDGQLFCYNMFAYLDGQFMREALDLLVQPDGKAKLQAAVKQGALKPDMNKRGAIRSVFDGRYQFSRYFSPRQHNRPESLEALLKLNDVEMFDLAADPHELTNLALDPKKHGELMLAMNAKLNRLIEAEVGEDVGQMLPGGVDAGWVATPAVNDM